MSKIIGLIACSSRKLGQDNPAEKYLAKDIYPTVKEYNKVVPLEWIQ